MSELSKKERRFIELVENINGLFLLYMRVHNFPVCNSFKKMIRNFLRQYLEIEGNPYLKLKKLQPTSPPPPPQLKQLRKFCIEKLQEAAKKQNKSIKHQSDVDELNKMWELPTKEPPKKRGTNEGKEEKGNK